MNIHTHTHTCCLLTFLKMCAPPSPVVPCRHKLGEVPALFFLKGQEALLSLSVSLLYLLKEL